MGLFKASAASSCVHVACRQAVRCAVHSSVNPPPAQAREQLGAGSVMDPSKPGFGLLM